jgi:archaeal flagellar protein FlaJ
VQSAALVLGAARAFPFDLPDRFSAALEGPLRSSGLHLPPSLFARFFAAALLYPLPVEAALTLILSGLPLLLGLAPLLLLQSLPLLLLAQRIGARRRRVEAELPFVVLMLSIYSHDAYPDLAGAFGRAGESADVFPALAAESGVLSRNIAYGHADETAAIESTFRGHPSGRFREFIRGYSTTMASGRDIRKFVQEEAARMLTVYEETWKSFAGLIASMTEVSFIFLALFPAGVQMMGGALLGTSTLPILAGSTAVLIPVTLLLVYWMDRSQPVMYDSRYPVLRVFALAGCISAAFALLAFRFVPAWGASGLMLLASVAYFRFSGSFFGELHRGEAEISSVLHDLAEHARAGASVPDGIARLLEGDHYTKGIRDSLAGFSRLLYMGAAPRDAQKGVRHPSWLVRVSFSMLAAALESGAGYGQLDTLSSSFRRVSDARRSIQAAVTPFGALGLAVPVISLASFWFLRSLQGIAAAAGVSVGADPVAVISSVLAASVLSGVMVSKAYSCSARGLGALPPVLCCALASILVLGIG